MQTPLSTPAINPAVLAEIHEMAGADAPVLVAQIIDCYLQESPALIAAMQTAYLQQDAAAFTRSAHSLKSSSQALGATRLSELCLHLEQIGRSGIIHEQADDIAAALMQLTAEYVRVEAALQQERNHLSMK